MQTQLSFSPQATYQATYLGDWAQKGNCSWIFIWVGSLHDLLQSIRGPVEDCTNCLLPFYLNTTDTCFWSYAFSSRNMITHTVQALPCKMQLWHYPQRGTNTCTNSLKSNSLCSFVLHDTNQTSPPPCWQQRDILPARLFCVTVTTVPFPFPCLLICRCKEMHLQESEQSLIWGHHQRQYV